jgi:hypothetical protein
MIGAVSATDDQHRAGVLTIGVVFTVLASGRGSKAKTCADAWPHECRERKFSTTLEVAFADHGLSLQLNTVTSDQVMAAADLRGTTCIPHEAPVAANVAAAWHHEHRQRFAARWWSRPSRMSRSG